jgi:long-chain fatty acid transport protein
MQKVKIMVNESRVPFKTFKKALFLMIFCSSMLFTFSGPAPAGGLYLNEFGTPSMATAGAGAQALANDASTSFHNPAGMTRLEDNQLMLTGGLLYADTQFDPDPGTPISGGDGGDAGGLGPVLGVFYTYSLSDDWKLGLNMISISAAVLDYDDDWTGRYLVQDVSIFTISFMPTVAYRANDWLSLGGGLLFMYGTLEQTIAGPPPNGTGEVEIDGDDTDVGFNLSVMAELSDRTRLGLIYASELEPTFSGDVTLTPPGFSAGIDAGIVFPQIVKLSVYHELNDRWALLGTIGWEDWSAFENITMSTRLGSQVIPRNWDDTWYFGVGVHYRLSDEWLLQGGIAYDTSPVDAEDRTPDMPIDEQIRIAVGAQYDWSERVNVGGAFVYADYGDAEIKNPLLLGEYENNNIYFIAFNVNWKF